MSRAATDGLAQPDLSEVARVLPARVSHLSRVARIGRNRKEQDMESGPAAYAGTVFSVFGIGLLTWTAARLRRREPVAEGVNRVASAALTSLAAMAALALGAWCFTLL
jgi:hypothetical protein